MKDLVLSPVGLAVLWLVVGLFVCAVTAGAMWLLLRGLFAVLRWFDPRRRRVVRARHRAAAEVEAEAEAMARLWGMCICMARHEACMRDPVVRYDRGLYHEPFGVDPMDPPELRNWTIAPSKSDRNADGAIA